MNLTAPLRWAVFGQRAQAGDAEGMPVLTPVPYGGLDADALERVAAGGTALDPEVVTQLAGASHRAVGLAPLTGREREVLSLMAEGRFNAAIAQALFVRRARWRSTWRRSSRNSGCPVARSQPAGARGRAISAAVVAGPDTP